MAPIQGVAAPLTDKGSPRSPVARTTRDAGRSVDRSARTVDHDCPGGRTSEERPVTVPVRIAAGSRVPDPQAASTGVMSVCAGTLVGMSNIRSDASAPDVQISERTLDVRAGQLHGVEAGVADGPPILFVHGWPQTTRAWHPVMRLAGAAGYRALAFDVPGVGRSGAASTDGSTDALAAVLNDVVGALGLSEVTLVGTTSEGWPPTPTCGTMTTQPERSS